MDGTRSRSSHSVRRVGDRNGQSRLKIDKSLQSVVGIFWQPCEFFVQFITIDRW